MKIQKIQIIDIFTPLPNDSIMNIVMRVEPDPTLKTGSTLKINDLFFNAISDTLLQGPAIPNTSDHTLSGAKKAVYKWAKTHGLYSPVGKKQRDAFKQLIIKKNECKLKNGHVDIWTYEIIKPFKNLCRKIKVEELCNLTKSLKDDHRPPFYKG